MSFDMSRVVTQLGDAAIGKCGEPLGLNEEQSVRVAHALAARAGLGNQEMIAQVAADTGLPEDVVAAMAKKLAEEGAKKIMDATGANAAIDNAKEQAMAAMSNAGGEAMKQAGGFLGGLFGRKAS
jgi:hypothetical protein